MFYNRPKIRELLSAMVLATGSIFLAQSAIAQPHDISPVDHSLHQHHEAEVHHSAAHRKAATESTESFINAHKQWAQAQGAANKAQALNNLIAKAEARREMLAELIQTNPAEVLRVAIPEEKQLGMPVEVQALLEQHVEIEGELEAVYEDYADGTHKLRQFLTTNFSERFEIKFAGNEKVFQNSQKALLSGLLLDDTEGVSDGTLAISDEESAIVYLDNQGSNLDTSITPQFEFTLGEQKTLLMLVNFSDNASQPWSASAAYNTVFGDVNDYIQENSSGRTWLTGDVAGWFTLSMSSTVCDSFNLKAAAQTAAAGAGFDLQAYDRFIYAFPTNACGYVGSASVGGQPSDIFINGLLSLGNVAHEFGHNLGLTHARALECNEAASGNDCSQIVYGDTLDVMGKSENGGHYNAYHKELLGWLEVNEVLELVSSSNASLVPLSDTTASGFKTIKVAKPSDSDGYYYIEYRQPIGFDGDMLTNSEVDGSNVANGVVIRSTSGGTNYSLLLDMTPQSDIGSYDWADPALLEGLSFTDPETGITVTANYTDSQGASVDVVINGSSQCTAQNPLLNVLAPVSQWGSSGESLTYMVMIENQDGINCSPRSFDLNVSTPDGWSATPSNAAAFLAPGETATLELTVQSAANAVNGVYDINLYIVNTTVVSSLTYVVDNVAANTAPVAQNDTVIISAKVAVVIDALANDYDPDGDDLTIVQFDQGSKGQVELNSDGTFTYIPQKRFKSTDQFTYSISDGQDVSSAIVTIQLQSSDGSDGGDSGDGGTKPTKGKGKR